MIRTLSLLVENNPGVLARISGLFSGKFYNLESLTVGVTNDPTVSRITIVCDNDDKEFEQVKKQLNRLVHVIKVTDLTALKAVKKELAFIKVSAKKENRSDIFNLANVFGCGIIDVGTGSIMLEACDTQDRINDLIQLLSGCNIIEIARSGIVAMESCVKGS